jgi:hypothetical protein
MLRAIDCVLPFSAAVDTVYDPLEPRAMDTLAGAMATVKSGTGAEVIVIDALAVCVVDEVPVTVNEVAGATALVVTVSVELPPALTVVGENVPDAPAGKPETESAIDWVLPFTAAVVTV